VETIGPIKNMKIKCSYILILLSVVIFSSASEAKIQSVSQGGGQTCALFENNEVLLVVNTEASQVKPKITLRLSNFINFGVSG